MKNLKNLTIVFTLILLAAAGVYAQQTAPAKATAPSPKAEAKTAAALPKADEIIDKFVQVTGGGAAYKKFNSFQMKGAVEIPAVGLKGTYESFHKAPNKTAIYMTLPGFGATADVFDGAKGWMSDPVQGVREKTADELAQAKLNSDFYRYARLKELYPKRETRGLEKVEGADAYAVVMTAGDVSETFYFDAKTGFLVRTDQIVSSPEGKIPAKGFLSDYRNFEGVMMPYTVRVEIPSVSFITKIEEIKSNVAIDEAKFAKPTK